MDTWNGDNYPITRFLSETGIESMPSLQTWQEASNTSDDFSFESKLVENREHHGDGQNEMMFVLKSFDRFSLKFSLEYKLKTI